MKLRNILIWITSRTVMIVAGLLLVASVCTIFFNPTHAWYLTALGLFFVPLMLLNLMLFVIALLNRSRSAFIPLLCLIPALFVMGFYWQPKRKAPVPGEHTFKIVSYNVGNFSLGKDWFPKGDECADSLYAWLHRENPDIICLQEFLNIHGRDIKSYLSGRFKGYNVEYYVNVSEGASCGNVILSKFPLIDKGGIRFNDSFNLAMYAEYDIYGHPVRIYNCHFQSYGISLANIASKLRKRSEIGQTEEQIKLSIQKRSAQVDQVAEHILSGPENTIVTGDFNDTPLSYTYYRFKRGRKDSFVERGEGFQPTFSILQPLLRIDYVLFPRGFDGISHDVPHLPYSDHYPVVARISCRD